MKKSLTPPAPSIATVYQAPRIETILCSQELEREVLYAGAGPISLTI